MLLYSTEPYLPPYLTLSQQPMLCAPSPPPFGMRRTQEFTLVSSQLASVDCKHKHIHSHAHLLSSKLYLFPSISRIHVLW